MYESLAICISIDKNNCFIVSSFFVSGFDPSIFLDAPLSIGDVMVDSSFYGNGIGDENEESIPRQLYNYIFSSQNPPRMFIHYIRPIKTVLTISVYKNVNKSYVFLQGYIEVVVKSFGFWHYLF